MRFDGDQVKQEMERLLEATGDFPKEKRREIIFHMTDWVNDFQALASFYEDPKSLDSAAFKKMLMAFLIHAPEHITAARKLVTSLPIEDVFKVGILEEE